MGAIVHEYHCVLRFPTFFSFSKHPKLGKPIFSLKDVPTPFARKHLQLAVSCIGSEGNGGDQPPRRRSTEKDGTKRRGSRKSNASNQEEIISLFRRIQTSIAKEESVEPKEIHPNVSEESHSSESILRILRGRQARKQKGNATNKEGEKTLTMRKDTNEQQIQSDPAVSELKSTRPPSNFVKRSPIPSPSVPNGKFLELNNGASPSASGDKFDMARVEEMKLPELKELAKSRGIKGYSKLKKSELVKLLKS